MQQTELWSSYMLAKFCQNVGMYIYKGEKKILFDIWNV